MPKHSTEGTIHTVANSSLDPDNWEGGTHSIVMIYNIEAGELERPHLPGGRHKHDSVRAKVALFAHWKSDFLKLTDDGVARLYIDFSTRPPGDFPGNAHDHWEKVLKGFFLEGKGGTLNVFRKLERIPVKRTTITIKREMTNDGEFEHYNIQVGNFATLLLARKFEGTGSEQKLKKRKNTGRPLAHELTILQPRAGSMWTDAEVLGKAGITSPLVLDQGQAEMQQATYEWPS